MAFAVRRENGSWTGAVYEEISPRIEAHHARFGEVLEPVVGLEEDGDGWRAIAPTLEVLRASWSASAFQVRSALREAGMLETVEAAISDAEPLVQNAWREAVEFPRLSASISALAPALGLDDEALDRLFMRAMQIRA